MNAGVLLHVRPDEAAIMLTDDLRSDGLLVVESPPGGEAIARALESNVDAALIDTTIESPVVVARMIHRTRPEAHIVFLTDDRTEPHLRRELLLAPRIGTHWSVTREQMVGQTVRGVLDAKNRRQQVRSSLNRMNVQLAETVTTPRRPIVSERFLATILNQLSDGVVVLDGADTVVTFNIAAHQMLGPGLRHGAASRDVFSQVPAVVGDIASTRGTEIVLHNLTGEAIFTELRSTPVTDDAGQRVGTAVVMRDVTQRTRGDLRRQFLAAAAGVFAASLDETTIVQKVADTAVSHFAEFCIVDMLDEGKVERRAVAAVGEQPVTRKEMKKYIPASSSNHPLAVVLRTGKLLVRNSVDEEELRAMASSESHLALLQRLKITSFVVAPLCAGQQVKGAILLARSREPFDEQDVATIDELARSTSSALQNAWLYRAADEANRAKDEFLATVSHELRTPMTSILGWVQLMRIGDLDPNGNQEAMGAIEQSARVQAQLIDDLLDLSRIQMGKLHLEVTTVDLADVLRSAVETIRPAAGAKDIEIEMEINREVGTISGDPNRLQQVFWNLLSNAVKFTGRRKRITVALDAQESRARVRVIDSGQGIEPDFLPFVFERFRQADSSITRTFGGLGLGLSIVKQITEMHGGTVGADSEGIGKGATFTILLPLMSVTSLPGRAQRPEALADLSGIRVLVVDDEASAARVITAVLNQAGAQVDTCHSSEGALQAIRQRLPDVLVSDIAMPEVDGFELIRRVRTVLRISPERLPAIALTALSDVRSRIELLGAGFQRSLRKPVDAAELAKTVADVARQRKKNR